MRLQMSQVQEARVAAGHRLLGQFGRAIDQFPFALSAYRNGTLSREDVGRAVGEFEQDGASLAQVAQSLGILSTKESSSYSRQLSGFRHQAYADLGAANNGSSRRPFMEDDAMITLSAATQLRDRAAQALERMRPAPAPAEFEGTRFSP